MKKSLFDFIELYKTCPIKDNEGGMKLPHLVAFYHYLKTLKPSLVIESGIWKGQGTWLIKKVLPNAQIISFDIQFQTLNHVVESANYVNEDLSKFDWDLFFKDNAQFKKEDILLFLDDHVDFNERLNFFANNDYFGHIIYEDNYPCDQGDCISPKKILEGNNVILDKDGIRKSVMIEPHVKEQFRAFVKHYEEFPPVCGFEKTRWGTSMSDYNTPKPICDNAGELPQNLFSELKLYTWICYMKTYC